MTTTEGAVKRGRAMRIICFPARCSTQMDDYQFRTHFPDRRSEGFWQREIADLEHQYYAILNNDHLGLSI